MGSMMAFFIKLSWPQDEFLRYGDNSKSMAIMKSAGENSGKISNDDWLYLKGRFESKNISNVELALGAAMETKDPTQKAELADIAYHLAINDATEPSGLIRGKSLVTLYRLHDPRLSQLIEQFKNDPRELVKYSIQILQSR